ncbi:hypothetical protein MetexDRAFT_3491 [Methylorubrum extorquens DSM 13060]|jgi:hypothetical protein|uniref:Uncharacterized protein n=1 Tax=Methylorubrum extorquens DSM 13060 TaxID=882800 RepID=H1KLH9_METEX|nr:hypothetical protein MetexDRAFT_3491 [Methylorubrum extorquens DSM 13060]MCP1540418.1 hypothetical protein [Methylorubrum extorquens]MCP1587045.1 hypothetical protein [Methylorubrum extorquens]BDL40841.1 hypothetical protein MSPGM_34310 [Methylorubrum sp. GM97]
MPNPFDPFGMADLGFAQAPRGLTDTVPALIKRKPYQSPANRAWIASRIQASRVLPALAAAASI